MSQCPIKVLATPQRCTPPLKKKHNMVSVRAAVILVFVILALVELCLSMPFGTRDEVSHDNTTHAVSPPKGNDVDSTKIMAVVIVGMVIVSFCGLLCCGND